MKYNSRYYFVTVFIYIITVLLVLGAYLIKSPGDISPLLIIVLIFYPFIGLFLLIQFREPFLILMGVAWVSALATVIIAYFKNNFRRLGITSLTCMSLIVISIGLICSQWRLK